MKVIYLHCLTIWRMSPKLATIAARKLLEVQEFPYRYRSRVRILPTRQYTHQVSPVT